MEVGRVLSAARFRDAEGTKLSFEVRCKEREQSCRGEGPRFRNVESLVRLTESRQTKEGLYTP